MHDLDVFADNDSGTSRRTSTSGSKLSEIIYGNDIDSVDIAIRASLMKFFLSPNVIGDFAQHCRVLRLYSRPLVAFQRDSFVISRHSPSDFVRQLAETQAAEYFAEWLVNPTNLVFRKVYNGKFHVNCCFGVSYWLSVVLTNYDNNECITRASSAWRSDVMRSYEIVHWSKKTGSSNVSFSMEILNRNQPGNFCRHHFDRDPNCNAEVVPSGVCV